MLCNDHRVRSPPPSVHILRQDTDSQIAPQPLGMLKPVFSEKLVLSPDKLEVVTSLISGSSSSSCPSLLPSLLPFPHSLVNVNNIADKILLVTDINTVIFERDHFRSISIFSTTFLIHFISSIWFFRII